MSGREWWTCEAGHEWREEQGDDECPYCAKEAAREQQAAADEWAREQMKDRQREDLGPDPRNLEYWERKLEQNELL